MLNYLRTSLITSYAAFPTALIAQLLKTNTEHAPISPQIKISGYVISIEWIFFVTLKKLTSSINALNSKNAAKEAEPTLYPFALALVTFPTASNLSVIALTYSDYPLISTIPPALSAIGPKAAIDSIYTPVQNIPIVAIAVPNSPPINSP